MGSHSAFFYGTLMAPAVLHRVCHGARGPDDALARLHTPLTTVPAVLPGYRRHRVRGADYPAIVPCPREEDAAATAATTTSSSSVRGTYVTGLSDADIWRLDIFEGDEYRRERVRARVLTRTTNTGGSADDHGDEDGSRLEWGEEVEAETYVWTAPREELEEREWDFDEFQREKMRFWVGAEGAGEYAEVDEAVAAAQEDGTRGRGANGHITHALNKEHQKEEILKNAV